MYKKTCPNCRKNSYSAYHGGQWICPHCGTDITKEKARSTKDIEEKRI